MSTTRLILQARVNLFSKPGGDTIQMNDLKDGLIRRGLRVEISTELKPPLDSYDIVHLFNITRVHETYIQFANAKRQRKPVVCSTIYHPLEEYNRKGRYGLGRLVFRIVRSDQGIEYVRGPFQCIARLAAISVYPQTMGGRLPETAGTRPCRRRQNHIWVGV